MKGCVDKFSYDSISHAYIEHEYPDSSCQACIVERIIDHQACVSTERKDSVAQREGMSIFHSQPPLFPILSLQPIPINPQNGENTNAAKPQQQCHPPNLVP